MKVALLCIVAFISFQKPLFGQFAPVHFKVHKAGNNDPKSTKELNDEFSFCPSEFSSTGITIECVSLESTMAEFYVGNKFIYTDESKPFTIQGETMNGAFNPWSVPKGAVTLYCYTNRGYNTISGTFKCASGNVNSEIEKPSLTWAPSTSQISSPSPLPFDEPSPPVAPSPSTVDSSSKAPRIVVNFTRIGDDYPHYVFEAGGSVLKRGSNHYLVGMGGYEGFPNITAAVYYRSFTSSKSEWVRLPDLPAPVSTHMGQAVEGSLFCAVGGFIGRWPGWSGRHGFCFDLETQVYKKLPDLPADRAGGGLAIVNDAGKRMLVFAGGTDRPTDSFAVHIDYGTTWTLELGPPNATWIKAEDMPYARNHMAGINVCGRVLFIGGQKEVDEENGNSMAVTEFLPHERRWSKNPPAQLLLPLGHVTASVLPYKCGVMTVGGITNGRKHISDVQYWHPSTNKWQTVGQYPHVVATPVCGIVEDELMCATGATDHWEDQNHVYFGKISAA